MRSFVVVVDVQGDFMRADGALPVAGAEALVAPMNAWLAALRPQDTAGVLYTFDTHLPEIYAGSPEAAQFPEHCVRGTTGWETMLELTAPDAAIPLYRLEKGVFDMWAEPALAVEPIRPSDAPLDRNAFFAALRDSGVETATVIGVAADFCVRWAVDGLLRRGFRVTVPAALTRGIVQQIDAVAQDFGTPALTLV